MIDWPTVISVTTPILAGGIGWVAKTTHNNRRQQMAEAALVSVSLGTPRWLDGDELQPITIANNSDSPISRIFVHFDSNASFDGLYNVPGFVNPKSEESLYYIVNSQTSLADRNRLGISVSFNLQKTRWKVTNDGTLTRERKTYKNINRSIGNTLASH